MSVVCSFDCHINSYSVADVCACDADNCSLLYCRRRCWASNTHKKTGLRSGSIGLNKKKMKQWIEEKQTERERDRDTHNNDQQLFNKRWLCNRKRKTKKYSKLMECWNDTNAVSSAASSQSLKSKKRKNSPASQPAFIYRFIRLLSWNIFFQFASVFLLLRRYFRCVLCVCC